MLEMLEGAAIGLVFLVIGVLLVFIGMPKQGKQPGFMRFDVMFVLYPALVIVSLAVGVGLMLRAYTAG